MEINYKVVGTDTNGRYSIMELTIPPGEGPPWHTHTKEDEGFYVISGTFRFWIGDKEPLDVVQDGHVFGPRDIAHRFQNIGNEAGKLRLIFTPAGCENYFKELDTVRQTGGPDLLKKEEAIDKKYGMLINRRG